MIIIRWRLKNTLRALKFAMAIKALEMQILRVKGCEANCG